MENDCETGTIFEKFIVKKWATLRTVYNTKISHSLALFFVPNIYTKLTTS